MNKISIGNALCSHLYHQGPDYYFIDEETGAQVNPKMSAVFNKLKRLHLTDDEIRLIVRNYVKLQYDYEGYYRDDSNQYYYYVSNDNFEYRILRKFKPY